MTRAEARRILESEKLVFGDPRQVAAVRCIEIVTEAEENDEGCQWCHDLELKCGYCEVCNSDSVPDWDHMTTNQALMYMGKQTEALSNR